MTSQYPFDVSYNRGSMYNNSVDAKVVFMGASGVGKTSLLQRFVHETFTPRAVTSTTGSVFSTKKIHHSDGVTARLQLWDTAGQERFRSMAPMFYRGANAALLVYDITDRGSLDQVKDWIKDLRKACSTDILIYIVGTKSDLEASREVTNEMVRLSLSEWFPPPTLPTPPPPPTPSALSYIRPRFTSFTSMTSPSPSSSKSSPPDSKSALDQRSLFQNSTSKRNNTSATQGVLRPRTRSAGPTMLSKINTNTPGFNGSPGGTPNSSRFTGRSSWYENAADTDSSPNEDETDDDHASQEWGLTKEMSLFEVSAKDGSGVEHLFDCLIKAIIRRDRNLEKMTNRDSIFLHQEPSWAPLADAEEARLSTPAYWSCCST